MRRFNRTIPLLALLVLVASLSGVAQTDPVATDDSAESDVNLRLLLFINEVGLDQQQMEVLVDLFQGALDGRDELQEALEALNEAFKEDMVAFSGTSDELAVAVEAYRTQASELTGAYQTSIAAMIETLGETLTYAQGQVFFSAIPQLAPEGFFTSNREQARSADGPVRMLQMMSARRPMLDTMQRRIGAGLLEDMVEVLELKLEAIG